MSPERARQIGAHVRLDQFGLGPADKVDLTYFETHRNRKGYRRKVIRGELTGLLRAAGVRTVFVFQIVDGALLRAFEDDQRRLISTSLFLGDKLLSTISGRAQVLMCLRLFAEMNALLDSSDALIGARGRAALQYAAGSRVLFNIADIKRVAAKGATLTEAEKETAVRGDENKKDTVSKKLKSSRAHLGVEGG